MTLSGTMIGRGGNGQICHVRLTILGLACSMFDLSRIWDQQLSTASATTTSTAPTTTNTNI